MLCHLTLYSEIALQSLEVKPDCLCAKQMFCEVISPIANVQVVSHKDSRLRSACMQQNNVLGKHSATSQCFKLATRHLQSKVCTSVQYQSV